MVTYSIVIPAYNEEQWLPATVEAASRAMAAQRVPGELIVVDNNSSDRTAAAAAALGARVVFEPVNQISRARNAGARASAGRFLIFADADTVVSPGLLAAALENLASGRCCGGGAAVAFDSYPGRGLRFFARLWNRLSVWRGLAAGAFVYCRREAFEAVGGFSQRVYAGEELFFSRSVRHWGRKRGLEFRIITGHPLVTSSRKLQWHSPLSILLTQAPLVLCPFMLTSKRFCSFWYRRPR